MNTIKKIWSNPDLRNTIIAFVLLIGVAFWFGYQIRTHNTTSPRRAYEVWSKHNPEHPMPYEEWLVLKRHRLLPGQQSLKP